MSMLSVVVTSCQALQTRHYIISSRSPITDGPTIMNCALSTMRIFNYRINLRVFCFT